MTGIVAQLIALTTYGNNFLINGKLPADFDTANSTFQFCNRVDFSAFRKPFFFSKPKEYDVAETPSKWFTYLKTDGCKKLRLYFENSKDQSFAKDHKLAGMVGGGGTWLIEAVYEGYSNYWANRWEVSNKDASDHKIWSVLYGMTAAKQAANNLQVDCQKIKTQLQETLTQIAAFADQQGFPYWSDTFHRAKAVLDSETPAVNYYHQDLIPTGNYSLLAKQVLFSAGAAWVFGGMGSWNDLLFSGKDNELYETLSAQLYANIIDAIIAACNSY